MEEMSAGMEETAASIVQIIDAINDVYDAVNEKASESAKGISNVSEISASLTTSVTDI